MHHTTKTLCFALLALAACGGGSSTPAPKGTVAPLPWPSPTQANGDRPARVMLARYGSGSTARALMAAPSGSTADTTTSGLTLLDITDAANGNGSVVATPLPATITAHFDDGTSQTYDNDFRYAIFVGGYSPFGGIDIDIEASDPAFRGALRGYHLGRGDIRGSDGLYYPQYGWGPLVIQEYAMPPFPTFVIDTTDRFTHAGSLTWEDMLPSLSDNGWYPGTGDGVMLHNVGFPNPEALDPTLYWAMFFISPSPNSTTPVDPNAPVPTYTIHSVKFHAPTPTP